MGQKGGTTTVCGEKFKYAKGGIPKSSHTEARILETVMGMGLPTGGRTPTLLMAINWNKSSEPSTDACPDCTRMICAAQKCVNIKLCDKDGKPQKPQCPKN